MAAPTLHRRYLLQLPSEHRASDHVSLREHLEMRIAYEQQLRHADDRRYSEVNIEREKALKIKEEADKAALALARDIQVYKDEKANELREQISSERGLYTTKPELQSAIEKVEALLAPLTAYVNAQQGRSGGVGASWNVLVSVALALIALAAVLVAVLKP